MKLPKVKPTVVREAMEQEPGVRCGYQQRYYGSNENLSNESFDQSEFDAISTKYKDIYGLVTDRTIDLSQTTISDASSGIKI